MYQSYVSIKFKLYQNKKMNSHEKEDGIFFDWQ